MRYDIKNGKVVESSMLNSPYDTAGDAQEDLTVGVVHNCAKCDKGIVPAIRDVCPDLLVDNFKQA